MDAESVGMVSIAIGLLLVIGVVRGTWKKLLSDVGLGSAPSAGGQVTPTNPSGQPAGSGIITPTGNVACQMQDGGVIMTESAAQCIGFGGTPVQQATTEVWGGQNTVTYQV